MYKPDDWSQDCLEYLFDNKVWLPGIVRAESIMTYDENNTSLILAPAKISYFYTTISATHRRFD